jgi:uncharacterized protein (TIGR03083 family)
MSTSSAHAPDVPPPVSLRDRVVTAALQARTAGRSALAVAEIPPVEAVRRMATDLNELLLGLSPPEWQRPALRGLPVQGLIGHLIGVEADFLAALTDPGRNGLPDVDHIRSTDPYALAEDGMPPDETRARWWDGVGRSLAALSGPGLPALDQPLAFHGLLLPLHDLLVIRAFELWVHAEDIRAAVGAASRDPDPATLQLMTAVAVPNVPAGMQRADRGRGGRVRLVLTGPGGGTWPVTLAGGAADDGATARIVIDAARFCRVVANRLPVPQLDAEISGDPRLADDLLVGASALALD